MNIDRGKFIIGALHAYGIKCRILSRSSCAVTLLYAIGQFKGVITETVGDAEIGITLFQLCSARLLQLGLKRFVNQGIGGRLLKGVGQSQTVAGNIQTVIFSTVHKKRGTRICINIADSQVERIQVIGDIDA